MKIMAEFTKRLKHIRIQKVVNNNEWFMFLEYDDYDILYDATEICVIHKDNVINFIKCLSFEENIYIIHDNERETLYLTGYFIRAYHKGNVW